jgi:nucleotide-binding universal stress UspA family protein
MLSRVLVPLDGSPTMAQIIPRLRQWFGGTGAVVHLLVVRPPIREVLHLEDRVIYLDELVAQEQAAWHRYLVLQGSQLAYDGVVVHREVYFGKPVAETLAAAERHSVHLIALVGQQQSWLQRFARPTLAQQLLAQSQVPVLVVPPVSSPANGVVLRYSGIPV